MSGPGTYKWSWTKLLLVHSLFSMITLLPKCFEITEVRQPETVSVGQQIDIEVDVEVTGKDGSILVFGILAPRAWQAASHTTVSFTSDIGGSDMSLMPPEEVDATNMLPWASQIEARVGIGGNYGDMEWTVFKADTEIIPPGSTSESDPVNGTIFVQTTVGDANLITQLGYFVGDALWGYIDDDSNSDAFFAEPCVEVSGGPSQAQNLCGPAPRRLIALETYTFGDILTIRFDAQEDTTALIGASAVYFCSRAFHDGGTSEVCEVSAKTQMQSEGNDVWTLTIWPPDYYSIADASTVSQILCNFQDESGNIVVKDNAGNDFQILEKCFR